MPANNNKKKSDKNRVLRFFGGKISFARQIKIAIALVAAGSLAIVLVGGPLFIPFAMQIFIFGTVGAVLTVSIHKGVEWAVENELDKKFVESTKHIFAPIKDLVQTIGKVVNKNVVQPVLKYASKKTAEIASSIGNTILHAGITVIEKTFNAGAAIFDALKNAITSNLKKGNEDKVKSQSARRSEKVEQGIVEMEAKTKEKPNVKTTTEKVKRSHAAKHSKSSGSFAQDIREDKNQSKIRGGSVRNK